MRFERPEITSGAALARAHASDTARRLKNIARVGRLSFVVWVDVVDFYESFGAF